MKFRTTLVLGGKTATGILVPPDIVAKLGSGKRPPVRITINGHTYRSTVAVMGGDFMVAVSAENRTGAGVAAGDDIEVDLTLDTEPRTVTVPEDFAAALADHPQASEAFSRLAYTHRKEHVRSIEEAKLAEVRQRRIAKAIAMLQEGQAL